MGKNKARLVLSGLSAKFWKFSSCEDLLLYRGHSGAEARFVPRAGVLVNDALFHGFIDHGNGGAEGFIGRLGVAGGHSLTQLAQRGAQTGGVGAVVFRAFGGLARALQRRKMICHCDCMVPIRKSFSEGQAEDAILLGFSRLGQWPDVGETRRIYEYKGSDQGKVQQRQSSRAGHKNSHFVARKFWLCRSETGVLIIRGARLLSAW